MKDLLHEPILLERRLKNKLVGLKITSDSLERKEIEIKTTGEIVEKRKEKENTIMMQYCGTALVEALERINEGATKASDIVAEIAMASNEQAQAISQVNEGLGQIDSVTQQNTANAEETSAAAEELSAQASDVRSTLSFFNVGHQNGHSQKAEPDIQIKRNVHKTPEDKIWGGQPRIQQNIDLLPSN